MKRKGRECTREMKAIALAVCVVLVAAWPVSGDSDRLDIGLDHPAPGVAFPYVPNIPLWLRIRKGQEQV
jgi:hypothetical protein